MTEADDRPRWVRLRGVGRARMSDGTTYAERAGTTRAPGSFARHLDVA
ncbi:MAG: hypothetical protein ACRDIZ_08390 [Actinomycetota bacterium]